MSGPGTDGAGRPLEPWWLPGLAGTDVDAAKPRGREARPGERSPGETESGAPSGWYEGRTAGGASFRTPRLTAEAAASIAAAVRRATLRAREARTIDQVVEAVARAAGRLADPSDAIGRRAAADLQATLGWTPELVEETLRGMAAGWTGEALHGVLHAELGDPGVLDAFRADSAPGGGRAPAGRPGPAGGAPPGRRRRAAGPPLLLTVLAGNVPGVAVTALIRALLVRSGVLCRSPSGEPTLTAAFARALAEEDRKLGAALAVTWWPIEGPTPWNPWVKRAGKVVVYGGESAVEGVRARLPAHVDLVAYGPRLGVGVVLADAAEDEGEVEEAARRLARDACAYEQQGCVSPRVVYVVGDPARFGRRLAAAMEAEAARIPRPPPRPEEAVEIRSSRAEAEFAGYAAEGELARDAGDGRAAVFGAPDLSWTVLVSEDPAPLGAPLRRLVRVCPLATPQALEAPLRPLEGRIQSIGYAGGRGIDVVAEIAVRLGVSRLAPLGTAAWPPPDWRHDGRFQLLPLLDWTDWEMDGPAEDAGPAE